MAYQALARTYRPQTFEEVVGQEHVTRTLKNAIEGGKISHAFLFSGPRGIGKTTTARILAKALNCEKGPAANPCNKCNNCKEVTGGSAMDVQEIDGASNRGIDDIRALRENVKYMPTSAKYKIYIIDEVHQITKEGFNALLKTLEEPPAHVIFMMATTEPEKIPATILSRCQRFSFKLVTQKKIYEHLKFLAGKEKAVIADDALNLVASCGNGSVRDAMSILDQVISFAGKKKIKKEDVIYILGIIPEEELVKFSDFIVENKIKQALALIDEIIEKGYDIHQFVSDTRAHFRNLLVVKAAGKDPELLGVSSDSMELLFEKSKKFRRDNLIRIIDDLGRMHERMKWSEQPRTIFEVGVFRLCRQYVSIDEILEKIAEFEGGIAGCDEGILAKNEESLVPRGKEEEAEPATEAKANVERQAVTDKGAGNREPRKERDKPRSTGQEAAEEGKANGEDNSEQQAADKEIKKEKEEKTKQTIESEDDVSETSEYQDDGKWKEFMTEVKNSSPMLYESLVKGSLERIEDGIVYIVFHSRNKFNKGATERKKDMIVDMVSKVYGRKLGVRFLLSDKAPIKSSEPIPDSDDYEDEEPVTEELYEDIKESEPVVKKVLEVFNGKITKRKRRKDDS